MLRIGVDAMGGDFAPAQVILGAAEALPHLSGSARIFLLGDSEEIVGVCRRYGIDSGYFSICHCSQTVRMDEPPVTAFRHKTDSSIVRGFRMLAAGDLDVFAGAGNTGAMLAGSLSVVGTVPGVVRPCISAEIPLPDGSRRILLDVGFNTDARPDVLYQFALMGTAYVRTVFGKENPEVALLNMGAEAGKGNMAVREAYKLMQDSPCFRFAGNLEPVHLFEEGGADVLVCDGFVGNVCLKQTEAFYRVCRRLKLEHPYLEAFDYEAYGGTPVLGIQAPVVIGHGASTPKAIGRMIRKAYETAESGLAKKIQETLEQVSALV